MAMWTHWPVIAGIMLSAVVLCSLLKLVAFGYGIFVMQQYSGVK
jgi:hypothetical protein